MDDDVGLREFGPLQHILHTLPNKVQKAFRGHAIDWTCLDVTKKYIAVGSDAAVVFLYIRPTGKILRLECHNLNEVVSCVKVTESVDDLVAIGTNSGYVCIFLLPSDPRYRLQQQKFEVAGVHHSRITELLWSQNAMKLFSGDEDGVVQCTDIDYEKRTSRTYHLHKEAHAIVQMDYASRMLLISTRFRSLIHDCAENTQQQVGTKDRKVLGQFGALYLPGVYQSSERVLFTTRPGFRLWKATADGKVNATYIYKDLVRAPCEGISLLGDSLSGCSLQMPTTEAAQFGRVLMYQEAQLVSYNENALYIIDPGLGNFVGYHTNLGKIQDVAVNGDEIYILRKEGMRRMLRIAKTEDPYLRQSATSLSGQDVHSNFAEHLQHQRPIELMTQTANSMFGAFKDMGEKLKSNVQEGQMKPKMPPWGIAGQASVEEARELDPSESPSPDWKPEGSTVLKEENKDNQNIPAHESSTESNQGAANADDTKTVAHVTAQDIDYASALSLNKVQDILPGASYSPDTAPGGPKADRWRHLMDHPGSPPLVETELVIHKKPKRKGKKKNKAKDKDSVSVSSLEMQGSLHSTDSAGADDRLNMKFENSVPVTGEYKLGDDPSKMDVNDTGQTSNSLSDIEHRAVVDRVSETEVQHDSSQTHETTLQSCTNNAYDEVSEIVNDNIEQNKQLHKSAGVRRNDVVDGTSNNLDDNGKVVSLNQGEIPKPETYAVGECHSLEPSQVDCSQNIPANQTELSTNPEINVYAKDPCLSSDMGFMTGDDTNAVATNAIEALNVNETRLSDNERLKSDVTSNLELNLQLDSSQGVTLETNKTNVFYDPLLNSDIQETNDTNESDDFYGFYGSPTSTSQSRSSITSPLSVRSDSRGFGMPGDREEGVFDDSLQSQLDYEAAIQRSQSQNDEEDLADQGGLMGLMSSTWNEFSTPQNLQSICVTVNHAWIVDKSERLYYSHLSGPGLKWHKVDAPAQQISVAPSGSIVWRMHRGTLYAGTKITTRSPAGLKWEDFVESGVAHVSVDENMGWYVKNNGELIMHKNLTRERPCYTPLRVDCDQTLIKVACNKGVVWTLTEDRNILVRMGIRKGCEEGDSWHYLGSAGPSQLVADFDLGEEQTAWVIDVVGRLWFMTGVSVTTPQGDGQWWQVSMTEYLMQDATAQGILNTIVGYPQKLFQYIQQADGGGLVSSRCNGIWACSKHKNVLHVCKGGLLGHRWETLSLPGIAPQVTWVHICASGLSESYDFIWTQQPNGGIFCFNPQRSAHSLSVIEVAPPVQDSGLPATCISVARDVVWVLMPNGHVYLRTGIHTSCPQGIKWMELDLSQLGRKVKFTWLCCGDENVWAVDNKGRVYLRIGVYAPSNQLLSPAWVPVDGVPQAAGAKFVKVVTGPKDWMVWAIDNSGYIYTRKGVTDNMPVGSHWVYVPGSTASDLVVSDSSVYAVTGSGEILMRCDITEENVIGNCWTKIPGVVSSLTAPATGDSLWGINTDGQLCTRYTHYLNKKDVLHRLRDRDQSVEGGWEMI